jgi:archaellin
MKTSNAFTDLEPSIVLIAFVFVAAVFSYVIFDAEILGVRSHGSSSY